MSNPVEIKRLIAEFHSVRASKYQMDFKIEERLAEIERLKENMKNQDAHLEKLKDQLTSLGVNVSNI